MSAYTDTFSLLLYKDGTFVRQVTRLTRREALQFGDEAVSAGTATRYEVWNEYRDVLDCAYGG